MDPDSRTDLPSWPGYFWMAAAGGAAALAVHVAARGEVLREAAWTLLVVGVVAMVITGLHRHRPDGAQPWQLLALAMGLLVVDNLVLFPIWGPSPVRELISDSAQLLALPFLGLVALGLVHRQVAGGDREGAIDAATIMVALFSALWGLVFAPRAAQSASVLGTMVLLVAPLLLAAVTAAGLRLLFVGGHRVVSMWLLVTSSVLALTGHVLRTLGQSAGTYERGEWQDAFVAVAYLAAGLAALHPSMRVMTQPAAPASSSERRLTLGRLVILGVSLTVPPVTMLLQADHVTPVVPLVASIAASILVMWRLWRLVVERERVRDEMRRLAIHDSLTGLPNRVALLEALDAALARGARHRSSTALIFIDLDGFKTINDTFGHVAGDGVLIAVADRLRSAGRMGDLLARLAGDEFVMVCEETDEAAARDIAERIMTALQTPVLVDGAAYPLTASVGVATSASVTGSSLHLMKVADDAMYEAKRDGGSAFRQHHGLLRSSDAHV